MLLQDFFWFYWDWPYQHLEANFLKHLWMKKKSQKKIRKKINKTKTDPGGLVTWSKPEMAGAHKYITNWSDRIYKCRHKKTNRITNTDTLTQIHYQLSFHFNFRVYLVPSSPGISDIYDLWAFLRINLTCRRTSAQYTNNIENTITKNTKTRCPK